eukprot:7626508-Pyramimonas_sp.AAC.1
MDLQGDRLLLTHLFISIWPSVHVLGKPLKLDAVLICAVQEGARTSVARGFTTHMILTFFALYITATHAAVACCSSSGYCEPRGSGAPAGHGPFPRNAPRLGGLRP